MNWTTELMREYLGKSDSIMFRLGALRSLFHEVIAARSRVADLAAQLETEREKVRLLNECARQQSEEIAALQRALQLAGDLRDA